MEVQVNVEQAIKIEQEQIEAETKAHENQVKWEDKTAEESED